MKCRHWIKKNEWIVIIGFGVTVTAIISIWVVGLMTVAGWFFDVHQW